MSRSDRLLTPFSVLALAGFAALLALFFPFTAEDAWIVARYARNAVEHGELVFNPGEPVNALTSPLDALLRVVLHALTPDPMIAHKVVGIACSAGALAIGMLCLRGAPLARTMFLALAGLSAPFALWTVGGLETPLLALVATVFAASLWSRPSAAGLIGAAVLAGLAFLARHDSVLFTAPALLLAMRRQKAGTWAAVCAAGAVLPLAWLGFALAYFHDLFPTSFHIKGPGNVGLTIGYNAVYLIDFLWQSGLALVLAVALCAAAAAGPAATLGPSLRARAGLWLGLGIALLAYGLLVATAHMMFSFRLLVAYLPVAALLCAELFAHAFRAAIADRVRNVAAGLLAALLLGQLMLGYAIERWTLNPARVGEYQYIGAGDYRRTLLQALPEAADVIAADWRKDPVAGRAPRVLTFAAGLLPWMLPDAYVFEDLVSWRRACPPDRRRHALLADYIHLATPWSGPLSAQLPGQRDRYELLWQRTDLFDGEFQTWMVFRNRAPDPTALPPHVDGPCRLPEP